MTNVDIHKLTYLTEAQRDVLLDLQSYEDLVGKRKEYTPYSKKLENPISRSAISGMGALVQRALDTYITKYELPYSDLKHAIVIVQCRHKVNCFYVEVKNGITGGIYLDVCIDFDTLLTLWADEVNANKKIIDLKYTLT